MKMLFRHFLNQDIMEIRAVALQERVAIPHLFYNDPLLARENLDYSEPAET